MSQGAGEGQKGSQKEKRKYVPWPFTSKAAPARQVAGGGGRSGEVADGKGRAGRMGVR